MTGQDMHLPGASDRDEEGAEPRLLRSSSDGVDEPQVVAHGGTIRVESCEETGTRFVIGLPRHSG